MNASFTAAQGPRGTSPKALSVHMGAVAARSRREQGRRFTSHDRCREPHLAAAHRIG